MPTNATHPLEPDRTSTGAEPGQRDALGPKPSEEEWTPEVQFGEDPGTIGPEDLEHPQGSARTDGPGHG
jgi:hypothetical protein